MMMRIYKAFKIDAAHHLPNVPEGHRCRKLHGHSFRIEVHIIGPIDRQLGWVIDFADIAAAFQPIRDVLDHSCLNEIDGLSNPTSENLACWIWQQLQPKLPCLNRVVVAESPDSACIYEGEL